MIPEDFPAYLTLPFRGEDYKIAVVTGKLSFSEERKESWGGTSVWADGSG